MIYKIPNLKKLLIISVVGITILTAFLWLVGEKPYDATNYFILLCGFPSTVGTLLGILIIYSATIYHRVVDKGIEPDDLVKDQIYYLNGEFEVIFLYKNVNTGKYVFKIKKLDSIEAVEPGVVRKYFSAEKEVG